MAGQNLTAKQIVLITIGFIVVGGGLGLFFALYEDGIIGSVAPTTGVTLAKFNQLQNGMTVGEAKTILGGNWELTAESGAPGSELHTVNYSIMGDGALGANVSLIFQGTPLKLDTKAQFGLK